MNTENKMFYYAEVKNICSLIEMWDSSWHMLPALVGQALSPLHCVCMSHGNLVICFVLFYYLTLFSCACDFLYSLTITFLVLMSLLPLSSWPSSTSWPCSKPPLLPSDRPPLLSLVRTQLSRSRVFLLFSSHVSGISLFLFIYVFFMHWFPF